MRLKERVPFVIPGIDVLNDLDVRLVVLERKSANSRAQRSVILHSSDGGVTWERQLVIEGSDKERNALEAVHFVSRSIGWAVGYSGTILKTIDSGRNWLPQHSPTDAILTKIKFVDSKWGWILAEEEGEILHTEDGGANWRSYGLNATGRVTSLDFRNKSAGWIVGENGQAFDTTDAGKSWVSRGRELVLKMGAQEVRDVVFSQVKFVNSDLGFVAAGFNYNWPNYRPNATILATTDGGRTWRLIVASESLGLRNANFVTNKSIWVVLGDYREKRLLHTIDGGRNWGFVDATPKVRIVKFVNANHGWLVAGLWDYPVAEHLLRTNDGGLTWSEVKLPRWTDDN